MSNGATIGGIGGAITGAGQGALTGAAIGGAPGALIGGGVGLVTGGLSGLFGGSASDRREQAYRQVLDRYQTAQDQFNQGRERFQSQVFAPQAQQIARQQIAGVGRPYQQPDITSEIADAIAARRSEVFGVIPEAQVSAAPGSGPLGRMFAERYAQDARAGAQAALSPQVYQQGVQRGLDPEQDRFRDAESEQQLLRHRLQQLLSLQALEQAGLGTQYTQQTAGLPAELVRAQGAGQGYDLVSGLLNAGMGIGTGVALANR